MRQKLLVLPIALLFSAPGWALTDATYEQVALDSLRLAPPGLARIASRHKEQLLKGALSPIATEGGADHLAHPRGVAEKRVEEQIRRIVDLINRRTPFEKIVYELGVLTHFVADLNNPLNTAQGDPRYEKIRRDFETYVARKLPKFRLTFTGHNSGELGRKDVFGFARAVSQRSAKFGPYLSRSYFPKGRMVSSRTFDDRHTAFGVASVTFQNAVGDCARLYVYLWKQVNGDLRGTPFYGKDANRAMQRPEGTFRW